jgi:hypothetical protein
MAQQLLCEFQIPGPLIQNTGGRVSEGVESRRARHTCDAELVEKRIQGSFVKVGM